MTRFRTSLLRTIVLGSVVTLAAGCGEEKVVDPDPVPETATFKLIQTEIFEKSCAVSGCHAGPTPTGNLSLESGVAYANLINVTADNPTAKGAGLVRVKPGDPSASFLYMKLAGLLLPDHGSRMPLGSAALDSNKLRFVREWIAAGAPDTGVVADKDLVTGTGVVFTPPPAPANGIQIHLSPFDILPGKNREIFQAMHSPNTTDIWVTGFDVKMRDNSHHFILYNYVEGTSKFPTLGKVRDLGDDMDEFFDDRNFFVGSQSSEFSYRFPPGVAMRLPANSVMDLNSHYVNPTAKSIKGEVYLNLHTTDAPTTVAQNLIWSNTQFSLPAYKTTTVHTTLPAAPSDADIYMLTSHMHRRGRNFRIYLKGGPDDGKLVYESSDWHLPVVKTFDPPLRVLKGNTLRAETDYYNESDAMVSYGPTSEDEMCILIGYMTFLN